GRWGAGEPGSGGAPSSLLSPPPGPVRRAARRSPRGKRGTVGRRHGKPRRSVDLTSRNVFLSFFTVICHVPSRARGEAGPAGAPRPGRSARSARGHPGQLLVEGEQADLPVPAPAQPGDRKSTRLNSSHVQTSYA